MAARGGRGNGNQAGRRGSASAVDLCCGRYDVCGRDLEYLTKTIISGSELLTPIPSY
jgi:hypothetical protein